MALTVSFSSSILPSSLAPKLCYAPIMRRRSYKMARDPRSALNLKFPNDFLFLEVLDFIFLTFGIRSFIFFLYSLLPIAERRKIVRMDIGYR